MDSYVTAQDVTDVYKAKRQNSKEVLKRADGSTFTQEEADTILYDLYTEHEKKGQGMGSKALANFIANRDFVEFRRLLPRDSQSLEQYCSIFKNAEALNIIMLAKEYPQIATSEQLKPFVDLMDPQSDKYNSREAIVGLTPIFRINYESQNMKKPVKNGLKDCMTDKSLSASSAQEATKVVKKTVLDKEKLIEETEQQK